MFYECPDEQATLLHITSGYGLLSAAKELLFEKNTSTYIDTKDSRGWTPLLGAAEKGHKRTVKLLLKKSRHKVVAKLLPRNANVDSKDIYNQTPLWWAAQCWNNSCHG